MRKLGLLKTGADAELALSDEALASAEQADAGARNLQQAAAAKATDRATQLETSQANAHAKAAEATAAKDAIKPDHTAKAAPKPASEAQLLLEPVSIYISRATQKIYVRPQHAQAGTGRGRRRVRHKH